MADELSRLKPVEGAAKKGKRVGRGHGSGRGRTCGKGQKGQLSRAGAGVRPGFEGGQMPLSRRLPKRGFTNIFAKDYTVINVGQLAERYEAGDVVDIKRLHDEGVVSRVGRDGLKVLGGGTLQTQITVRAARFTRSAREKIEAMGGTAEAI